MVTYTGIIQTHALPRWDAAAGSCARGAVGLKNDAERTIVGGGGAERTQVRVGRDDELILLNYLFSSLSFCKPKTPKKKKGGGGILNNSF